MANDAGLPPIGLPHVEGALSTTDATACGGPPPALIVTCAKSPPGPPCLGPRPVVGPPPRRSTSRSSWRAVAEDTEIDKLYYPRSNPRLMKRPLTRTEVAIYASHRRAWQRVLDDGAPCALVLSRMIFVSAINTLPPARGGSKAGAPFGRWPLIS